MTNTQKPLEVRIDGELVVPTFSEQAIQLGASALQDVWRISSHLGAFASQKLGELAIPVYLDIVDAKYGSNLRREYFDRKKELAVMAVREEVGL